MKTYQSLSDDDLQKNYLTPQFKIILGKCQRLNKLYIGVAGPPTQQDPPT